MVDGMYMWFSNVGSVSLDIVSRSLKWLKVPKKAYTHISAIFRKSLKGSMQDGRHYRLCSISVVENVKNKCHEFYFYFIKNYLYSN